MYILHGFLLKFKKNVIEFLSVTVFKQNLLLNYVLYEKLKCTYLPILY